MIGLGFHPGVSALDYHADRIADRASLSSSLAKVIVEQTPKMAWLGHPRLNPAFKVEHDDRFNLGDAVHDWLSSGGARVRVIAGFSDYKKEAARTERDEIREAGAVPLLEHQADAVNAIVSSVRHELARREIDLGAQEAVFVAEDHGILLRAMMDSWHPPFVNDFKISAINLANDFTVGSHIADLGYDLRAWFYLRVASLVFPEWAGRLRYRWIFVEKDEPHGVRIVEADATQLEMGRRKGSHALGLWQNCIATGQWPHLEGLPATVPYPGFAETRWLDRETKEGFVTGPLEALKRMNDGDVLGAG